MQIAIGLYPGFTALDAIGPYQVLTNVPGVEVVLCAASAGPLADDMGLLRLDIEHTFDEVAAPDVMLVPGGLVTRKLAADGDPIVEWVRSAHEHTTWTHGAVYAVSRDGFRREWGNEWLADNGVVPVLRVLVRTSDFTLRNTTR